MSVMECVDMDVGVGSSCVVIVVVILAAVIMMLVVERISGKHAVCYHMTSPVRKFMLFNFAKKLLLYLT